MNEYNPILTFDNTDSKEEMYFYWWILDCIKAGFINGFQYHPKSYTIMDSVFKPFKRKKVRTTRDDRYHLFNDWEYTPDFVIEWNDKNIFHFNIEPVIECRIIPTKAYPFISQRPGSLSFIDVKGKFIGKHNNSAIIFPYNQRMMYEKYNIYVNKTIVPKIFEKTFTPKRYLWTDAKTKKRIIHFPVITIEEYLKVKDHEHKN